MPPVKEAPLIDIGPFKGIDNFTASYFLEAHRCVDCLNINPDTKIGSYVTVLGRSANTGALPTACLGFTRFDRQGLSSVYIGAADQSVGGAAGLWQWTKSVAPTLLTYPSNVTPTASEPSYFAAASGATGAWLFMVNGDNPMIKIDPSLNVTLAQLAAPTVAPTTADSGNTGNLNSQGNPYLWRITFGNAAIESGPGPISTPALTITNHSVTLTNIQISTDPQCTNRNIYRLGGTWSVWKLVGTINNNSANSFTDNVADTALGQTMVLVRDQPISGAWYINTHKDRLFTFGTDTDPAGVYFSNYREPWSWDQVNQYFTAGSASANDFAQGLASLGSVQVLFKNMTTWVLYGDDPTSFILRKILDIGCAAPRSITGALGVVFWVALDGGWMYDTNRPIRVSTNIQTTILGLSAADLGRAAGAYRNGVWYLSFPAQGVTYALNIATQEWYKLGWAGETFYSDPTVEEVDASRPGLGNIDTWFATPTDLGASIGASFTGKIDDSGSPQSQKTIRYLELIAPIQTGQTAAITVIFDPGATQSSFTKLVDLGASPIRKQLSIPPPQKAYQSQINLTTVSSSQIEIQRLQAIGWSEREYAVPQ